jgi:hypothetical protein
MSKLTGNAQVFPTELFGESSVQQADLGSEAFGSNKRKFVYVKAGATALVPGKLQQAPASVANHQNCTVAAAVAAGSYTVTATLGATAATANQYADGLMIVNDVAGEGHTYEVKSHAAVVSAGVITVTLSDPIVVALTTSSQVSFETNLYNGVILNPTTPTNEPVGVAIYPITANYYGWIQTRAKVSCLNDSGTAVGLAVAPSQAVAGAVKTGATTLDSVGSAAQAGVDTEYNFIDLRL